MTQFKNYRKFVKECPDCGETDAIVEDFKNGYDVCGKCGCVLKGRIIDEGTEWRNFSEGNKPDKSRVGAPVNPFLETSELDTMIAPGTGQGSYSLNKMQVKSYVRGGGTGKNIKIGINLIEAYCSQNQLARTVSNRASTIYKKVEEEKIVKGKSRESIVSACIYIACKQQGCSRTFKEISAITSISKNEIGRCYKAICKKVDNAQIFNTTREIIPRFCSELGLNSKIQNVAAKISSNVYELDLLTGRSPDSVAGAVIYLVILLFPENKNLIDKIQKVTSVTDNTIRTTFRDLLPHIDKILPEEYVGIFDQRDLYFSNTTKNN